MNRLKPDNKDGPDGLRLKDELDRLKRVVGLGHDLRLCWRPDDSSVRHGEVSDGLILIYDSNVDEALRTLRHEFLDHLISREIVEPLVKQINMQKRLIEFLIYERKELIIERIIVLIDCACAQNEGSEHPPRETQSITPRRGSPKIQDRETGCIRPEETPEEAYDEARECLS